MRAATKIMMVGAIAAVASGCATVKRGAYEKIEIVSNPPAAYCKIYRDGQGYLKSISTPDSKYIERHTGELKIVCSKKGYKTATVIIPANGAAENDSGSLANIATLGLGFIIDEGTSARSELPDKIEVNMERM